MEGADETYGYGTEGRSGVAGGPEAAARSERKNLDSAQFEFAKLQVRVKLFGEADLDDKEREAFVRGYPEDIAKHEA